MGTMSGECSAWDDSDRVGHFKPGENFQKLNSFERNEEWDKHSQAGEADKFKDLRLTGILHLCTVTSVTFQWI